jgi:hypothetical protein
MTAGRTPNRFELNDLATNRILFALTLLGVLLPLNLIASNYRHVGFTYQYAHRWLFWKPFHYHLHAITFFYSMEALLALAVYFYAFNLIFRRRFLEYTGTGLFTVALLVPVYYLYSNAYSLLLDETASLGAASSVTVVIVGDILSLLLWFGGGIAIFRGLEWQGAPATTEPENDLGERLLKLEGLMKTGLLKQEEYNAKRAEIIELI